MNLTNDKILRSLITFTLPIMLSYLFQQCYNMADTVIVGHYLGENALGAIGACAAIFELLVGFGNGFGNGLSITAARAFGAKDETLLKKTVAASVIITMAISASIAVFGLLGLKPLLQLLGTPSEILETAHSYILRIAVFSGVLFFYNLLSGLLRAVGNSIMPLLFLIAASILNIGLDILLITVCKMGVSGTAVATVIAQGISGILCLLYILRHKQLLVPHGSHFRPNGALYRDLVGQGLSMALMSALVSSGSIILQSAINNFGTLIIAGHICARTIFMMSIIPLSALALSIATFVSQNLGAGKIDRIRSGVRLAYLISIIYGALCTIVLPLLSKWLIRTMSGSDNADMLSYSTKYICFMQPFYAVLGILLVTRNSLQGLGAKLLPLISSIIELLGKMLFTWLIIPMLGLWGIIICEPLIWVAMTVQLVWSYRGMMKNVPQ